MGPETADTGGQPAAQQDSPQDVALATPETELLAGVAASASGPVDPTLAEPAALEAAVPAPPMTLIPSRPSFVFFGVVAGLAMASDLVRKPFFLGVSVAAIAFIISLYARLTLRQKALRWGLPLVLGGALGNLNDRITRSQVIDFIDFRADWIMDLNVFVHRYVPSWAMTDHWPTFNVADVEIGRAHV